MKRLPWKYLAGLFDGEGCFDLHIGNGRYIQPRARMTLIENCRFILEYIQNSYGGTLNDKIVDNPNWSNSCSWELVGYRLVCMFIHQIIPHLIIKKEQAKFLLWMQNNLKGKTLSKELIQVAKKELSLMKKDPHRLSDEAVEKVLQML